VFRRNVKDGNNEVPKARNDFEILQLDAFATPMFHLASGLLGLTAESGMNSTIAAVEFWKGSLLV
jgi:hypothetical protein